MNMAEFNHRFNNIKKYAKNVISAVHGGTFLDGIQVHTFSPARALSRRSEIFGLLHASWKSVPYEAVGNLCMELNGIPATSARDDQVPNGVCAFFRRLQNPEDDD